MKNVKLSDDKKLGGKGRLTDDKIDQLQRYYGLAIRRNLSSVDQMKDAVGRHTSIIILYLQTRSLTINFVHKVMTLGVAIINH